MEEEQKIENDYFLKHDDESLNKNIMTEKNDFRYKNNENENKSQNDDKNIMKYFVQEKEVYKYNNNDNFNKYYNNKYERFIIVIYFIMSILFCHFGNAYSFINLRTRKNSNDITFYSYEIKLKVKGTGLKNILGSSSHYNWCCPSKIYIKNKLFQNYTDCHYIEITEPDSEIKLIWDNTIFLGTGGMFYNCMDITEIDMTNFDTSSVDDMSNMFALCSSLKILKVDNLNISNVYI